MDLRYLLSIALGICCWYGALSCPDLCNCYFGQESTEVICNNIQISVFPANGMPRNTTRLTIQYTNITTITGEDLLATPLLKELHLSNNMIRNLSTDMLIGVPHLHTIDLTGNQLMHLPSRVFHHAPLDSIALKNNLLSRAEADWLPSNSNLTWIDLSGNRFQKIPAGLLQNLGRLITLDLSENKLEDIPAGVLDLLTLLERLSLQNNKVRTIDPLAFKGTYALSYLFLQYNRLEKLSPTLFQHVKELRYLDLSGNHLRHLPDGALDPNVLFVDLGLNPWHCDAKMDYLWKWERKSIEVRQEETKAVCALPVVLKGRPLASLSPDELGVKEE
ncbi:leucine-rich alpha-2-glycoprotein [Sardina pilchardus]|uniref:leucine-rich alpha-2-glycoprotein n=1 Tax=Sardina pilchardus TaxID=27697 RepID=UPI002E124CBC